MNNHRMNEARALSGRPEAIRSNPPARGRRVRLVGDLLPRVFRGAIVLAGLLMLSPAAARSQTTAAERAGASRAKGSEEAPLVIYEVADFQCPYCARFATEVMPKIDSAYIATGKIRWVFINFPVPSHRNAWAAAEAAVCSGAVADRFWAMHDLLYARQDRWSGAEDPAARFRDYAEEIGLSLDEYRACVRGDKVAPTLLRDVMTSTSAQVQGTPTFFIGSDTAVVGFRSFEEWQKIIESALNTAG